MTDQQKPGLHNLSDDDLQKIHYGNHYGGFNKPLINMPTFLHEVVCTECCYMFKQQQMDDKVCPDCIEKTL
jgi:hypothetical protein